MRQGCQTSLVICSALSRNKSEIESLASRNLSAALQLRFAQNDKRLISPS